MIFQFIIILIAGSLVIGAWIGALMHGLNEYITLLMVAFTILYFLLTIIYIKENEERLEWNLF